MSERPIDESTIETLCAAGHIIAECDNIETDISDLAVYVMAHLSREDAPPIINALTLAWAKVHEARASTRVVVRKFEENKKEGANNA